MEERNSNLMLLCLQRMYLYISIHKHCVTVLMGWDRMLSSIIRAKWDVMKQNITWLLVYFNPPQSIHKIEMKT